MKRNCVPPPPPPKSSICIGTFCCNINPPHHVWYTVLVYCTILYSTPTNPLWFFFNFVLSRTALTNNMLLILLSRTLRTALTNRMLLKKLFRTYILPILLSQIVLTNKMLHTLFEILPTGGVKMFRHLSLTWPKLIVIKQGLFSCHLSQPFCYCSVVCHKFFVINCGKEWLLCSAVSCIMSLVSHILYHVSCLMSPGSRHLSPVSRHLSPVLHFLSPVSCLLSHVSHLLSHVSYLTSSVSSLHSHFSRLNCTIFCITVISKWFDGAVCRVVRIGGLGFKSWEGYIIFINAWKCAKNA